MIVSYHTAWHSLNLTAHFTSSSFFKHLGEGTFLFHRGISSSLEVRDLVDLFNIFLMSHSLWTLEYILIYFYLGSTPKMAVR